MIVKSCAAHLINKLITLLPEMRTHQGRRVFLFNIMRVKIITQVKDESVESFNERVNLEIKTLNSDLRTIEDITFSFSCYAYDTGSTIYTYELNSVMIKYYL